MPDGEAGSIVGRARSLAASSVRAFRTRLELIGIEIEEEKARLRLQIMLLVAALFLFSFGVLLGVAAVVMTVPAEQRVLALSVIALLCVLGGGVALVWLHALGVRNRSLFATTIAVLKRDEQALEGTST